MKRTVPLLLMLAAALSLTGCDTLGPLLNNKPAPAPAAPAPQPKPQPKPVPAAPPPPTAAQLAEQAALREGIELYNKGAYKEALKRFSSPEVASGSKAGQVTAAKYSAFSYCVSARQTLCRQQFDKAFKLDPAFDLQPGEHGHPLWGPAFARAKKNNKENN